MNSDRPGSVRAPEFQHILIRATNWVGDAVMSLPALRLVRARFPYARITLLARPWVADVYYRETFADCIEVYPPGRGRQDLAARWTLSRKLRRDSYDAALLLPNSFESAAVVRLGGIPTRIGYARDARSWLLTQAVKPPRRGEIPRHEAYYYLELLRRIGWIETLPQEVTIRFFGMDAARAAGLERFAELRLGSTVIGVSPGAAYGGAKRWLPERFAESVARVAGELGAGVALFGSAGERPLCGEVAAMLDKRVRCVRNLAGETTLRQFIELAAACRVFLTNDSGSMHIAYAAGVPTVAVFGATDHLATGPTGSLARVVRHEVECSPCLLRECPIDHRCMLRVTAEEVADTALALLK